MSAQAPVSLTIDGTVLQVPPHTLVIRAAEMLGITIPRFCDHPLLDPVAACRQCLVEVEGQRKPLAACATTCTPDMVVKTQRTSDLAKDAQEGQLEFLLVNHPLDCPQCDKGGECPLQDQALAHGPADSRMVDRKRVFEKPVPISPQVALDRERCVLCARCTRFSKEISGDPFIELFERGALAQVAIYADEPYSSYFSGNVVQICPVGALTSASYRFGARPFDLHRTPGIAYHDASGAHVRVDTRGGVIQRQLAAEHADTNESWLDDKNRYGYAFVAHPDRLTLPVVRSSLGAMEPTSWPSAVTHAAGRLKAILEEHGPEAVAVLTGGRLTDEDAYAVSRYAREVLATDHVDFRTDPRGEQELAVLHAVASTAGPAYADVEAAPVVVVAGLDAEEEAATLWLRLRKAWRKRRQKIVVVGPFLGCYREIAWRWVPTAAGQEAAALETLASGAGALAAALTAAGEAAVVLAGERLAASPGALGAAVELARTLGGRFAWVPRRPGARAAVEAGLAPGLLPGGHTLADAGPVADLWGRLPGFTGLDARSVLEAVVRGEVKALHLIGVDPARDFADPRLARAALERVDLLIVQDLLPTETVRYADVILPACAPPERAGSFTNWEGRRQAWPQALAPDGQPLPDWAILHALAVELGADLGWHTAADVRREAAPLLTLAGSATARLSGELMEVLRGRRATTHPLSGSASEADHPPQDGQSASEADPDRVDRDLIALPLPYLLGKGTMLTGAKELLETARPAAAWLHPEDAAAAGVADGQTVTVQGAGGALELLARVTDLVVPGCVVVPANSTATVPGELAAEGAPAGSPLLVSVAGGEV